MPDASFAKKLKLAIVKLIELPVQTDCILCAADTMPRVVTFIKSLRIMKDREQFDDSGIGTNLAGKPQSVGTYTTPVFYAVVSVPIDSEVLFENL